MDTQTLATARRTAFVLATAQAIIGSANPIAISIGGLVGYYLLDADKSLATAPITGFMVGMALGAVPAATIVRSIGQRRGFMVGTVITAIGGALAAAAIMSQGFWLFALALAGIGFGNSFVQQFRFAAADNAPPEFKARAISFVLAGGLLTAIMGPQIVIFTRELLAPHMFAGSFIAIPVIAALGALVLSFLPRQNSATPAAVAQSVPPRPLREIVGQRRFVVALICGIGSYSIMSFVMTGAPLAMVGCGFTADQATLGISWHVVAMFGPSFFTGRLIARFGAEKIVGMGLLILVGSALVALSGIALWQFWTSLILLGLGWNFGFIGATTMVAESYRPSEKARVQGFHDLILFSTIALASLLAGATYNAAGWDMLNWVVFPVCALGLGALAWQAASRPVQAA